VETVKPVPVPHPAKFSEAVMVRCLQYIDTITLETPALRILDPFAGVGGVHFLGSSLCGDDIETFGIELEKEWADQHDRTTLGDAQELIEICEREGWSGINTIVTSPCYGNRMADHHNAKDSSKRITYKHKLGRDLSEGSSATMQWGDAYRQFHWRIWANCTRLIRKNVPTLGYFILNCKDHVRKGVVQEVTLWHVQCLESMGWETIDMKIADTPGMGFGANREKRSEEYVALLRYQR
jgi:hypothetical protein